MPKPKTNPALYDSLLYLCITDLKAYGLIKPNKNLKSYLRIEGFSEKMLAAVCMTDEQPYCIIQYSYNGEKRSVTINLLSKKSNLGQGLVWYFECPDSFMMARKLYFVEGNFYHREIIKNSMYASQTLSRKQRYHEKLFDFTFRYEKYYRVLEQKHYKRYFKGLPTKRYLRDLNKIEKKKVSAIKDLLFYNF